MSDLYSAQAYRDDRTADAEFQVSEDVRLRLPLEKLRVASATVEVLHPVSGSVLGPVAATVPTTVATTNNTTSRGSKTIRTTSDLSSVRVGEYYFLDGPGFEGRTIKVTDVNDGTGFTIDEQLVQNLPSGATLRATTVTHTVAAGTLARTRGYRARWVLTPEDGSATQTITTYFDVVFQPFQIPLTKLDVKGVLAGSGAIMDDAWRDLIRGATQTIVNEFDTRGLAPDRVRDARPFVLPAAYWIAAALIEGHRINTREGLAFADRLWKRYREAINAAFNSTRSWYNHDRLDDDVRDADEEGQGLHFWTIGGDGYTTLMEDG